MTFVAIGELMVNLKVAQTALHKHEFAEYCYH